MDNVIQPTSEIERDRITLILHMSADYLSVDIAEQKDLTGRCHITDDVRRDETLCTSGVAKRSTVEVADYPMNMARNVAREFIKTEFLLLSDVDLMFSEGFERRMVQSLTQLASSLAKGSWGLGRSGKKMGWGHCVMGWGTRKLRSSDEAGTPRTKLELAKLLERKEVDVFHVRAAFGAHDLDGRSDWLTRPENFTYSRYTWEPRFVGRASVPLHDEAFPYRIRANNVLGWEKCRAGYVFALVEDLFTFHRAKRMSDYNRQSENHVIQMMNRGKYELALASWRKRMDYEYPETRGSCPDILRKRKWFYTEE
ncbi:hypothetical protein PRIPAC_80850 [Pristionchus pacificus]|nr:hypothetical protein PRIPAC_80850 [Pristionchus pacificus]